jgi:hypothetical protein
MLLKILIKRVVLIIFKFYYKKEFLIVNQKINAVKKNFIRQLLLLTMLFVLYIKI